ncbi:uncharacterized protein EV422DRAFT_535012 [Fimicolochytrium jonesii]|uniref:uncharacterized protein n=1 Tax=Fimicolochytrium jonesii TaxID=1396493 RepID=UPI0022FDF8F5|nr:uncharacterized protein EV422DRAFT_535012 [Fimicolochytrium jonesii]KAI8819508.1 hypothetical protein EV422DRAFT_535012 [Fimicolochytrium jonesii]
MPKAKMTRSPKTQSRRREHNNDVHQPGPPPVITAPTQLSESFSDIVTLTPTNLWPAEDIRHLDLHNPVVSAAFSLAAKILSNPATLQAFVLHVVPRSTKPSERTRPDSDYELLATIKHTHIANEIRRCLPVIKVQDLEKAYMVSEIDPQKERDTLIVRTELALLCTSSISDTERVYLAVLFGIKLAHEVGHVLLFRSGFGARTTSKGTVPRTPPGIMGSEAGTFFEHQFAGGYVTHLREAERQWLHCMGLVVKTRVGTAHLVPLSWAKQLLREEFWKDLTRLSDCNVPLEQSPALPNSKKLVFASSNEELELMDEDDDESEDDDENVVELPDGWEVFMEVHEKRVKE